MLFGEENTKKWIRKRGEKRKNERGKTKKKIEAKDA
jgi:hypothetical protein